MKFIVFVLGVALSIPSISQAPADDKSSPPAKEIARDLAGGALIVRLNMKQRTIEAYRDRIKNTNNESYRLKLLKDLEALEAERENYKNVVMNAFKDHYRFSQVYFIENHHFGNFLDGNYSRLFDSEGNAVVMDPDASFYILVQGKNDLHWIIKDAELNGLPASFPAEYNLGFKRVLNWLTGEDNANPEDMKKIILTMEEKMGRLNP